MTRAATLFAVLQALASIQSNPVEAAAAHWHGRFCRLSSGSA